ncbi:MAG: ATPase domain-containing protein [Thermoplasmata archaeon]
MQTEGEVERIPTHIKGLDERMEGGIPVGHIVLLCGRAGSMKSTLAFSIVYNAAKSMGKRSLYISLEQRSESLLRQMRKFGMDISGMNELVIMDLGRLRGAKELSISPQQQDWMPAILRGITAYKNNFGCELVVIDSLDALYTLSSMENPRVKLYHFVEGLRDLGVTVFLVSEIRESETRFGQFGVESFLSDGIIHIDLTREGKNVGRWIGIAKMRETNHVQGYFPLIVDRTGFRIVTK